MKTFILPYRKLKTNTQVPRDPKKLPYLFPPAYTDQEGATMDKHPSVIPSPSDTEGQLMPASREELQLSLDYAVRHKSLPQFLKSRDARQAFRQAFELIGGVPRLALWADQNPSQFYTLYARFLSEAHSADTPPPIQLHLSWMKGRDLSGQSSSIAVYEPPEPDDGTGSA